MTTLYICEKPSLANAIAQGLGIKSKENGYITTKQGDTITWCFGHMLEQLMPEEYDDKYKTWNLDDLPFLLPYRLKIKESATKQYRIIKRLLSKASTVVNAGDPDEEGQLLIDEILQYEQYQGPVKRVLIADLTPEAVKKSLRNLKPNDDYVLMGKSALARSMSDYIHGLNLTRAYTVAARQKGMSGIVPVGRVQTALVNLVYERQKAIEHFDSNYFYNAIATVNIDGVSFEAEYLTKESDPTDEKGRLTHESAAQALASVSGKEARLSQATHKEGKQSAPMPYNLSALQADCAKQFGFSAEKTLELIQSLYEKHKLLSYPRSDCKYLGDDAYQDASTVVNAIEANSETLASLTSKATFESKHKAFNSKKVTAHTAIIPTAKTLDLSTLKKGERQVYELVARSFLALGYADATHLSTQLVVDIETHQFKASNKQVLTQGWKVLFALKEEKSQDALTTLTQHAQGECQGFEVKKSKTKPPKYYVESTLIEDLPKAANYIADPEVKKMLTSKFKDNPDELGGIGTPATRASILKRVFEVGFLETRKEKGYKERIIVATPKAQTILDLLPDSLKQVDLTARWADMQHSILKGELSVKAFVKTVYQEVAKKVESIQQHGLNIDLKLEACPECEEGKLIERESPKAGKFHKCNQCDFIRWQEKRAKKPGKAVKPCPSCEGELFKRQGKSGEFLGCNQYPECKHIEWLD